MDALWWLLWVLHLLTAVALLLTALAGARSTERVPRGMLHAAATMLLTGLLLVPVTSAAGDDVNHARVAVKTIVALAILVLVVVNRRRSRVSSGLFPAVAGFTLFNATLAFLWN